MMQLSTDKNYAITFLTDSKYRIHRHIVLQTVILLISIGIFFDTPDKLNLSFNRFCGWVGYFLFMNMLVYINVYVLFPRFLAKDKIIQYVAAVVLFTLFAMFILTILQSLFYDIAVTHQEPGAIAIFLSLTSSFLAIMLFIGGMSALLLFKPLMQSKMKEQKLKISTIQSELTFLKSQINPHFLFNTINNANILIDDEPNMAADILTKLDGLLTYQFADSLKEKVCLTDDIHFLADYLELEKVRRDQFEFTITTNGIIDNITIAPLLFIPFVENAVKHNSDSNGLSYVNLSFIIEDSNLLFICENSKPPNPVRRKVGGIGLSNISRRLDLLYDDNYLLEKDETDQKYTVKLSLKI